MAKEKCLNKNYIYNGKILNLRADDVIIGDKQTKREVIEHRGGACVLCERDDGKIIFVRQYRYAYGEELLELPAGKLEEGEAPQITAERELEEETGYTAERLDKICVMYPSPGYTEEKIYIYRCKAAGKCELRLDEFEDITLEFYSLKEALEMVSRGEIKDAKTIIALSLSERCNNYK